MTVIVQGGWLIPAENVAKWLEKKMGRSPPEGSTGGAYLWDILDTGLPRKRRHDKPYGVVPLVFGPPGGEECFHLVVSDVQEFRDVSVEDCELPKMSPQATRVRQSLEEKGLNFVENEVHWYNTRQSESYEAFTSTP